MVVLAEKPIKGADPRFQMRPRSVPVQRQVVMKRGRSWGGQSRQGAEGKIGAAPVARLAAGKVRHAGKLRTPRRPAWPHRGGWGRWRDVWEAGGAGGMCAVRIL